MSKLKEFIQENKDFHAMYGTKKYLITVSKLAGYIIINPLLILVFLLTGHYILALLWIPFTIYGLLIAFQGKNLLTIISQYMIKRQMKKMQKMMNK